MKKLFVSPHNDDAVLFGAFTLQREHPAVLTVFDSFVQPSRGFARADFSARREEDNRAIHDILGCELYFGGVSDLNPNPLEVRKALAEFQPEEVWIPAVEFDGHDQHNLVGLVGREVFSGAKIHQYLMYTRGGGKSVGGKQVPCNGVMARKKLCALAQYVTQIEIDGLGCWPHFIRDQNEYVLD